jgi:amino acid transporter
MVAWSFLALRRREPDMPRPFRVRRGTATGITALVLSIALLFVYLPGSPAALIWPYEWLICLGWAVLGVGFYAWARNSRSLSGRPPVKSL